MSKEYKMNATVFLYVDKNMPFKTQQYKSVGTKAQVIKDLKAVVDKYDEEGLKETTINVTISRKGE